MVEEKDLNRFKVVELKSMLQQHGVTPKGLFILLLVVYFDY